LLYPNPVLTDTFFFSFCLPNLSSFYHLHSFNQLFFLQPFNPSTCSFHSPTVPTTVTTTSVTRFDLHILIASQVSYIFSFRRMSASTLLRFICQGRRTAVVCVKPESRRSQTTLSLLSQTSRDSSGRTTGEVDQPTAGRASGFASSIAFAAFRTQAATVSSGRIATKADRLSVGRVLLFRRLPRHSVPNQAGTVNSVQGGPPEKQTYRRPVEQADLHS
jgi:hypothetical protein